MFKKIKEFFSCEHKFKWADDNAIDGSQCYKCKKCGLEVWIPEND